MYLSLAQTGMTTSTQNDPEFLEIKPTDIDDYEHKDEEANDDPYVTDLYIDPSKPISTEYDPIEITTTLVNQEMQKFESAPNN